MDGHGEDAKNLQEILSGVEIYDGIRIFGSDELVLKEVLSFEHRHGHQSATDKGDTRLRDDGWHLERAIGQARGD